MRRPTNKRQRALKRQAKPQDVLVNQRYDDLSVQERSTIFFGVQDWLKFPDLVRWDYKKIRFSDVSLDQIWDYAIFLTADTQICLFNCQLSSEVASQFLSKFGKCKFDLITSNFRPYLKLIAGCTTTLRLVSKKAVGVGRLGKWILRPLLFANLSRLELNISFCVAGSAIISLLLKALVHIGPSVECLLETLGIEQTVDAAKWISSGIECVFESLHFDNLDFSTAKLRSREIMSFLISKCKVENFDMDDALPINWLSTSERALFTSIVRIQGQVRITRAEYETSFDFATVTVPQDALGRQMKNLFREEFLMQ